MSQDYDIIIVGAGMVGASLALNLSGHGLSIALIESKPASPITDDDPADSRVSAITPASQQFLSKLKLWPALNAKRLSPYQTMTVWEQADQLLTFDCAEIALPLLGHIVENRLIANAAFTACQYQTDIDVICPATPLSFQPQQLELDNGKALTAKLIIAADGGRSQLRDWAGIQTRGWSYHQQAIVATVTTEKAHGGCARQKFLSGGPLAFLPLAAPHQCSIVWSLPTEQAESLLNVSDEDFQQQIAEAFDFQLGVIESISQRAAFPLQLRHAESYVAPGFALVGDAAHTIHPLAGQGVNIGFKDAQALAEVVIAAAQQGRDIGSIAVLSRYQRRRRADNIAMQLTMDGFKRLFGNNSQPVALLRQWGLKQVSRSTLLKNLFMSQAAGRSVKQLLLPPSRH